MEKLEIQNRVKCFEGLKDLVSLLNDIKSDKFPNSVFQITEKSLLHYSHNKIVPNRYKKFYIRKKSGGVREINAPCNRLSLLLYLLNEIFKATIRFHSILHNIYKCFLC